MTSARLPVLGPAIPRSGNLLSRAAGRLSLRVQGWRVEGNFPNVPKMVLIAAPHTSNWDFVVGLSVKLALGLEVKFLGKDSLFRFPLGPLMRAWGGIPIDRSTSNSVVSGIVREFEQRDRLLLVVAPEGTRKRVERWRTGFYHIAHSAGVPIVPIAFNFGARAIQIGAPFATTGDVERDVRALQDHFSDIQGRRPKS